MSLGGFSEAHTFWSLKITHLQEKKGFEKQHSLTDLHKNDFNNFLMSTRNLHHHLLYVIFTKSPYKYIFCYIPILNCCCSDQWSLAPPAVAFSWVTISLKRFNKIMKQPVIAHAMCVPVILRTRTILVHSLRPSGAVISLFNQHLANSDLWGRWTISLTARPNSKQYLKGKMPFYVCRKSLDLCVQHMKNGKKKKKQECIDISVVRVTKAKANLLLVLLDVTDVVAAHRTCPHVTDEGK